MDLNFLEETIISYFNSEKVETQNIVSPLSSKSKKREYVEARRVFVVISRALYSMTYQQIADYLNRDHSTIMHMFKSSINLRANDIFFKNLENVLNRVKGGHDVLH